MFVEISWGIFCLLAPCLFFFILLYCTCRGVAKILKIHFNNITLKRFLVFLGITRKRFPLGKTALCNISWKIKSRLSVCSSLHRLFSDHGWTPRWTPDEHYMISADVIQVLARIAHRPKLTMSKSIFGTKSFMASCLSNEICV